MGHASEAGIGNVKIAIILKFRRPSNNRQLAVELRETRSPVAPARNYPAANGAHLRREPSAWSTSSN